MRTSEKLLSSCRTAERPQTNTEEIFMNMYAHNGAGEIMWKWVLELRGRVDPYILDENTNFFRDVYHLLYGTCDILSYSVPYIVFWTR